MIYKFLNFLKLLIPYGLILWYYRYNKATLPNIKAADGTVLKAIMLTENYGILVTAQDYIKNRLGYLRTIQDRLNAETNIVTKELNELSFEAKEEFYRGTNENN